MARVLSGEGGVVVVDARLAYPDIETWVVFGVPFKACLIRDLHVATLRTKGEGWGFYES